MLDTSSRPRRGGVFVSAALAGVAMGIAFLGAVDWGAPLAAAAAVVAGIITARFDPPLRLVVTTTVAALATSTVAGLLPHLTLESAVLGFVQGSIFMLCFVIPVLLGAATRQRRAYVERGWELAQAQAREQDAHVEQAVRRERDAMASEIHDGLGHRLTLIAVQAARLSLDDSLPAETRTELQGIRANAAAAADELGETVGLLSERHGEVTASLRGLDIADVLDRARSSGIDVYDDIADDVAEAAGDHVRAALLRALQEGLTNAAKHAPGSTVTVSLDLDSEHVTLRIGNPLGESATTEPGNGIVALRHRVEILGGELDVEHGRDFVLTVRLPLSAVPAAALGWDHSTRAGQLTAEAETTKRRRRRAEKRAWQIPVALVAAVVVSSVGYFVYVTIAATLPPERFAAIEVGDQRSVAEELLPPV
ncbi:MAG: sensor histidine kinase, partial [Stackebrandtia sp.]